MFKAVVQVLRAPRGQQQFNDRGVAGAHSCYQGHLAVRTRCAEARPGVDKEPHRVEVPSKESTGKGSARTLAERKSIVCFHSTKKRKARDSPDPTESSQQSPASQATSSGEVHGIAVVGTPGLSLFARSSFFSSCAYPKAAATIMAVRPLAVATLTPCAPALMSLIRPHAP